MSGIGGAVPVRVGRLLEVHMHGRHIADLTSTREGRAKLEYQPGASDLTVGLSCSLPSVGVRYQGEEVLNWLGGLLPDRSEVLAAWRSRYGVRRSDAFALLWHVGQDVAGAARFIQPGTDPVSRSLRPVSDVEVGRRVRDLTADASAWSPSTGTGQFSLAGAQAKFALARTDSGWAVPSGAAPTTHIFKPAIPRLADQDLNEHLTMRLAAEVGLPVAPTWLEEFDGARVLIVRRFDRYPDDTGAWHRVHQEDAVQALGLSPSLKYESQGGPGAKRVLGVLRDHVTDGHALEDIATFLDAVAFNWLVVGTDAHARNYAVLHHGQSTRLAPLYDLNSFLPYRGDRPSSLAMRVGFTEVDPAQVSRSDWDELARDCAVDSEQLLARIEDMAGRIVLAAERVVEAPDVTRWESSVPAILLDLLDEHVTACRVRL
ncbi:MAG: HipA domain-containing protein [Candidatus Nanopelagicales bacterium]